MSVSLDITYFLSIDTWTEYGFTDTNTDVKKLRPIIKSVQRNRIKPIIGTTLYNKLIEDVKLAEQKVDPIPLTGLYKELMIDHILPTMIVFCDMKATIHTTNQITNKTTGKNSDQHIQANDEEDNNDLRNELGKDAGAYVRDMKAWLCDNWNNIPELSESVDSDMLRQTIMPHLKDGNDLNGSISIL